MAGGRDILAGMRTIRLAAASVILFCASVAVSGQPRQEQTAPPASPEKRDVSQAPVTAAAPADSAYETVYLSALDKSGQPITDLKPEEVRIFDDKVEEKIISVLPASNEPLTIGLFFDVSGSRRADRSINEEVQLAKGLVHSIWHDGDTGFVLAFGSAVFAAAQPTHKLENLDDGLDKIPDVTYYGSTSLYDALCVFNADQLNKIRGRKVYVALSDFEDNSSRNRHEDVIQLAQAAKIAIFPVILSHGFGGVSSRVEKRGRQAAQEIADKTGGGVLVPKSAKELKPTFEGLAALVRSTYNVSYSPPSIPGNRRKKNFRVELTRPHGQMLFARN